MYHLALLFGLGFSDQCDVAFSLSHVRNRNNSVKINNVNKINILANLLFW